MEYRRTQFYYKSRNALEVFAMAILSYMDIIALNFIKNINLTPEFTYKFGEDFYGRNPNTIRISSNRL